VLRRRAFHEVFMTNATRTALLPRSGVLASARAVVGAGAVVAAATVAVNALAFVVPVLAARLLLPEELSALGSLLALAAVTSVVGVGLQTALAVRWAKHETVWGAGPVSLFAATATAGLLLVAVPLLSVTLELPPIQPVLLAVLTFPVVLAGRWLGELQGRRHYARLAAGLLLLGLGRFGGMLIALAAGTDVTASLAVGSAGAYLAVVAIAAIAGHGPLHVLDRVQRRLASRSGNPPAAVADDTDTDVEAERVNWREVVRASGAAIAMLAVSYADLLLARALLPSAEAGAYTVGSVLTKGAIWAPSALTVLALPAFAQARRHAVRITLLCTGACGVVLVAASVLFGDLAVGLAGGKDYGHLAPYAAGFAVVGALYALVYVFVNAEIAAHVRRPALWLWFGLAGLGAAAVIVRPTTIGAMLALSMTTATVTTAAMSLAYLVRRRRQSSEPEPTATDDPAPPVV
jgi:O-antigen/teichoic acid export membrane protein